MIKELMHDPIFLAGKSEAATKEDLQVAQDLLDTLMARNRDELGETLTEKQMETLEKFEECLKPAPQ